MATFLAFLGLVLDGGSAYLDQLQLQRDADIAAVSAAWAFYHSNYQDSDNFPVPVGPGAGTGLAAANAAAMRTLQLNGYPADADAAVVTATDVAGNPAGPGPTGVRGVRVQLGHTLRNNLLGAVGVSNPHIAATAVAVISGNTGARHEAPLLVQNYTGPAVNLPRFAGYGACPQAPADGQRYTLVPDCRPSTAQPRPQPFSLQPAWTAVVATPPYARFYLLHEHNPDGSDGGAPDATRVRNGLSSFVPTCPANVACDPTLTVFADTRLPTPPDPVFAGMTGRLTAAAGGAWAGQSCATPTDPAKPLAPDNPRLFRVPVAYQPPAGPSPSTFKVSETIVFCLDSIPTSGSDYALSGFLIEMSPSEPTGPSQGDPYCGRDVTVKLIN
jgi:hypothetical protein